MKTISCIAILLFSSFYALATSSDIGTGRVPAKTHVSPLNQASNNSGFLMENQNNGGLTSFEVSLCKAGVCIQWSTTAEKNNAYFILERSKNGVDFESISLASAAGNSEEQIHYLETDFSPSPGTDYYRLKQVGTDGSVSYSELRRIEFSAQPQVYVFSATNTSENISEVKPQAYEDVLVVIMNASGEEVVSKVSLNTSNNSCTGKDIQNNLPSGMYLITASSRQKYYASGLLIK